MWPLSWEVLRRESERQSVIDELNVSGPSLHSVDQSQCLVCLVACGGTVFLLSLPNEASEFNRRGVDLPSVLLLLFDVVICILNIVDSVLKLMYCIKWREKWPFRDCLKSILKCKKKKTKSFGCLSRGLSHPTNKIARLKLHIYRSIFKSTLFIYLFFVI